MAKAVLTGSWKIFRFAAEVSGHWKNGNLMTLKHRFSTMGSLPISGRQNLTRKIVLYSVINYLWPKDNYFAPLSGNMLIPQFSIVFDFVIVIRELLVWRGHIPDCGWAGHQSCPVYRLAQCSSQVLKIRRPFGKWSSINDFKKC